MPEIANRKRRARLARSFRRATNVERDWSERCHTTDFILTTCARTTLRRLLAGLRTGSTQRAWTLTGPYGTGKSSFCLYTAKLLAPGRDAETIQARRNATRVDGAIGHLLQSEFGTSKGLCPVLVTGSREPLQLAIARVLSTLLRANKSAITSRLASELDAAAVAAPRRFLSSFERAIERLTASTPGAAGSILILDELGKLLEYAAGNPADADVYLLQQLAELACRADSNFAIVGVLHQDFVGYSKTLPPSQQHEWEKIRGRFEDVVFEQSTDDMLRLIAEAVSHPDTTVKPANQPDKIFRELCTTGARKPIITEGNQRARIDTLVRCFPVHPVVSTLLGPVFKRFGQNERSAFSFIRSAEPLALPDFVSRWPRRVFRLVDLYQYLIGVFGDALLFGRDGRRWGEAFNVEAQNPSLSTLERDVLHTIALLSIVGRWHNFDPTADAISFALAPHARQDDVQDAIRSLQNKSVVIFRKFNSSYMLWEGSDIDVEAKISEARAAQAADTPTTNLLHGIYAPRPFVARRHSFERGTLRYFDVIPIAPTLQRETANAVAQSTADGHIFVLLHDQGSFPLASVDAFNAHSRSDNVVLCIPASGNNVHSLASELAAIDAVQHTARELHNDPTALREINARKEEVRRRLDEALAQLLTPGKRGPKAPRWFHKGREFRILSRRKFNECLSSIFDDIYRDCPIIQNEIINRRDLSSSAAAAQGELLKAMIARPELEHLGIVKNPPSKSIYLSVLNALGLHRKTDVQWELSTGPTGLHSSARAMMKAIRRFLDESIVSARPVSEMFELLRCRPFGVRDGVIPILVCASILAHEADVALYERGRFVPHLDDAALERFVKSPDTFAVRRWHVAGVRAAVFEQLAQMLGRGTVGETIQKRDLLDVVRPLMRFARRLNDFSKMTKTFSPVTLAVRQALLHATEPDELLFTALPMACGLPAFAGRRKHEKTNVQLFRDVLQGALAELQKGYDTLLQALLLDVATALESPHDAREIRSALQNRAAQVAPYALSPDLRVFSARLADTMADDHAWVESIAAFLANKHPSQWIDDDRAKMGIRLAQISDGFRSLESLALARRQQVVCASDESVQLAVTGTGFPETKLVVHIADAERGEVAALERRIASLIHGRAADRERRVVVAALARVVRSTINSNGTPTTVELTA